MSMKFENDVLVTHGERMYRSSKKKFRTFLQSATAKLGFNAKIDKHTFAKNVIVGDPTTAKYIFMAHYDTPPRLPKFFTKHMLAYSLVGLPLLACGISFGLPALILHFFNTSWWTSFLSVAQPILVGLCSAVPISYMFGFLGGANKTNYNDNSSGVLSLLNIMEKLKDAPQNVKDQVCFVFTDNEEKGLLGSMGFVNRYGKSLKDPLIINLDCVGRGKQINAFYMGTPEGNKVLKEVESLAGNEYTVVPQKTTLSTMSDHISFGKKYNCATLLCVDKQDNKSIYGQIHSSNDHVIESENINYIADFCAKKVLDLSPSTSTQLAKDANKQLQMQNTLIYKKKKLTQQANISAER